jgi:hypothetical protein
MAVAASILAKVDLMAKGNRSEIGDIDNDIAGHMAPGALGKGKGLGLVMASSAGLSLLHFGHGNGHWFFDDAED